jgi:hypothetical protein
VVVRFRTRRAFLVYASVASIVASMFVSGVAHADYSAEIANARTGKCVSAQVDSAAILQEPCQHALGQNWTFIGMIIDGDPFQIKSDTGLCMDIQSFSNAGPVVQLDCGLQAVGSYWVRAKVGEMVNGQAKFQFKSYFANYCLDLENGWSDDGLPLQVWQCNTRTNNQAWYHPFP